MLVRDCRIGDVVLAKGWDVMPTRNLACGHTLRIAHLVPHRFDHEKSKKAGHYSTLLYLGKVVEKIEEARRTHPQNAHRCGCLPTGPASRTWHRFLIEGGQSVALYGADFKYLDPCKS
jgi:hypothetical protein